LTHEAPGLTNAFQIHEWIYECLQIPEEEIRMIQIYGVNRHVYIKFTEEQSMDKILQALEDKRNTSTKPER